MVVMHTPNLNSVKTKARKSGGEGQPQVHIKFKASLRYKRPCLKKKKRMLSIQTPVDRPCEKKGRGSHLQVKKINAC